MSYFIEPSFCHNTFSGIKNATRKHLSSKPYAFKSYSDRFVKNTSATKSYFSWLPNFGTVLASILSFVGVGGASDYINTQNNSSQTVNTLKTTQSKKQETVQERKETPTAPVYNCSYAPEKPIKKEEEKETKHENIEYCCNAGASHSLAHSSSSASSASSAPSVVSSSSTTTPPTEENASETSRIVKAKQVTFKGPLSMEPTEFIDEIWDEFIKTLGEDGDKDIRKFLSQPKVLNRLAANRNKKMREYFQKKAEDDLADNKIIQDCKNFKKFDDSVDTFISKKFKKLSNEDITDIFNKRVAELGFANVPTLEISPKTEGPNGEYVPNTNIVSIYKTDNTKRTINTIFHELTHAKQHELVDKYFDTKDNIKFKEEEIENLKKISQDDKIRLLAMLLAQCQYDCTFTNGCNPQKTVQLCDYKNLNNEVEAFAYGDEAQTLLE